VTSIPVMSHCDIHHECVWCEEGDYRLLHVVNPLSRCHPVHYQEKGLFIINGYIERYKEEQYTIVGVMKD
jgi:hypothetical protein